MGDEEAEPLARTRTRRSNAGARMHEMIFNAEADPQYAQAFGDLLKTDDDSSDDEEYVPKEIANLKDTDNDNAGADDDDGDEDNSESNDDSEDDDDSSDSDSDSEDDDDDEASEDENNHKSSNLNPIETGLDFERDSRVQIKKETHHDLKPGSPNKLAYAACKKICSVCLGDQSAEQDEIIECDSCGVSVHESCYGVANQGDTDESIDEDQSSIHSNNSSESTEPWFCEPCRRSVRNPVCELCPNLGGIFKQTDTGRWIHMVCALYTRGITFENVDNLTDVSLFELNYALYGSKVS